MIHRYRKKPIIIDAIKFDRNNWKEIQEFTKMTARDLTIPRGIDGKAICIIETLEGYINATEGDYIIKGVHGEFYPCKPDIFEETYEYAEYGEMF